jgi:iron(III) transport system substrate-binding protein
MPHLPPRRGLLAVAALAGTLLALPAAAADAVLNLYSARHYQTDEALYSDFTKRTGIRINRIEAGDEALLERLRNEGRNTPADVLLLVDAARLWRAQIDGMFQPVRSQTLESRIPAHLRGKDDGQGAEWFAFSTRARVIVYNKASVSPDQVRNYADLASPTLKGKVCTRSGTHPYMLSLIGAMSEHLGEAKAESWARGVVANFARSPRGGDTDQIKAVATGECGVALTNTYYLVRMMRSEAAADKDAVAKIGMVWPDQQTWGTHVNVSGGGVMRNAPNRAAAVKFLEYLASDSAQAYLADGNNEWPAVPSAPMNNPVLSSLGQFKADTLPIGSVGRAQVTAAKIIDRAGWR